MILSSLLPISPCHTKFYSHSPLCPCRFFKSSLWSPSVLCQLASLGPSPSPVLALRSTICPSCGSSLGQSSDDFYKAHSPSFTKAWVKPPAFRKAARSHLRKHAFAVPNLRSRSLPITFSAIYYILHCYSLRGISVNNMFQAPAVLHH